MSPGEIVGAPVGEPPVMFPRDLLGDTGLPPLGELGPDGLVMLEIPLGLDAVVSGLRVLEAPLIGGGPAGDGLFVVLGQLTCCGNVCPWQSFTMQ